MYNIEHQTHIPEHRHYERSIFLMHGAWHSIQCWKQYIEYFTGLGYVVHGINLPGRGKSPLEKGAINSYSLADYVAILKQEIEKITPAPILIGHSMGGFLSQMYLESHRLPGAVLMASSLHRGNWVVSWRFLREDFFWYIKTNLKLKAVLPDGVFAKRWFLNPDHPMSAERFFEGLAPESFWAMYKIAFTRPRFKKDTALLVMAADQDKIVSVKEQREMAGVLGADFQSFRGAHNIMMDISWKESAESIHQWIQSLEG